MEIILFTILFLFSLARVFAVVAIPGVMLGWLLSYLNLTAEGMTRLILIVSVLLGMIGSIWLDPQGNVGRVLPYAPPIALALFIGRWMGTTSRQKT